MQPTEELPDGSNFFATLRSPLSKQVIANIFGSKGWAVRKCAWSDFEVRCDWAELVIDGESPVLVHGPVAHVSERAATILSTLRDAQISYVAESYGSEGELLQEQAWTSENDT